MKHPYTTHPENGRPVVATLEGTCTDCAIGRDTAKFCHGCSSAIGRGRYAYAPDPAPQPEREIVTVDGRRYEFVPSDKPCTGCAGEHDDALCSNLPSCCQPRVIFRLLQPEPLSLIASWPVVSAPVIALGPVEFCGMKVEVAR